MNIQSVLNIQWYVIYEHEQSIGIEHLGLIAQLSWVFYSVCSFQVITVWFCLFCLLL